MSRGNERKEDKSMIAYDLQCINGHTFEGWFESAETFDQQNESGLIACPVCNEKTVSKRLSTFAIKTSSSSKNSFASSVNLARINQKIVDYVEKNLTMWAVILPKRPLKFTTVRQNLEISEESVPRRRRRR